MKRIVLCTLVVLQLIQLSGCLIDEGFNDISSMEKKIASELETDKVTVFDYEDVGIYRFVGYSTKDDMSFAVFKQDGNKYIFEYAKNADKMLSRAKNIVVGYYNMHWVAISFNEDVKSVKVVVNSESNTKSNVVTINITKCPCISVFKLPTSGYAGEYYFYNKNGEIIS